MPKLKRKKKSGTPGEWHIDIPNYGAGPPVYTLQVRPAGRDILLNANLDHDDTPKRTAYVDWDLYRTIDNLNLLYTNGEDSNSTSNDLQPADQSLEDLSPEQRVAFANGLVKRESVERLVKSEQILELLQSLSSKTSGYNTLLTGILKNTPFEPDTIISIDTWVDKYSPARSPNVAAYDTTLLTLVIKLVFETFASNSGELFDSIVQTNDAHELWLLEESLALGGNEIILYPVADHFEQEVSEAGREHLGADSIDIVDPLNYRFLETVYPCMSKRQLQAELKPFRTTVKDEVDTRHFLLFPKPANRSNSELQTVFDESRDRR